MVWIVLNNRREILIHIKKENMQKLINSFFPLLCASVYAGNWTDWKPVGDPNRGIMMSTLRGGSYGGSNVMISVWYWNKSPARFKGDVVLKYVQADGTTKTKNDTVDLPPTSQPPNPDPGDFYIATDLTAEKLIEKGSSGASASQGVDEKTFPGEFSGWQIIQGLPNVFAQRDQIRLPAVIIVGNSKMSRGKLSKLNINIQLVAEAR
jgi:hypothetical protein